MTKLPHSADALEKLIKYDFHNKTILEEARRRRAFQNDRQSSVDFMDPLATLGDAVLDLVAVYRLYEKGERAPGLLTEFKSRQVKRARTREFAAVHKFNEYILWGKGEIVQKGYESETALDTVTEALIGAVFLDAQKNRENGIIIVREMLERMGFFDN
jgi:ribonuclease-3